MVLAFMVDMLYNYCYYCYRAESFLAAQTIVPIARRFSVAWSVCLSSVTFVHYTYTVRTDLDYLHDV